MLPFRDRGDAAAQLLAALQPYRQAHPLVLAIPRGAVPMARFIADGLGADLDIVLVRKLGAPGWPELAIGAVDEEGRIDIDAEAARRCGADAAYLRDEGDRQLRQIRERRRRYGGRGRLPLAGRTVIVVDDGLATGATMLAALRLARAAGPARLVCAVPVASPEGLASVKALADEVVCLAAPTPFQAVGLHYRDFGEVDDAAVQAALAGAPGAAALSPAPSGGRPR